MIAFTLRFPLGVYHALGVDGRPDGSVRPEWPPSPVRLVGALLAAAHEVPSDDLAKDRAVLDLLCAASPPILHAPVARPFEEQWPGRSGENHRDDLERSAVVSELRGVSRWVPRNVQSAEIKALSPQALRISTAAVDKGGVAIGELPVKFFWPEVALDEDQFARLGRMASDVAWVGTSRSPAIVTAERDADPPADGCAWQPQRWDTDVVDAHVRVPTSDLLERFDVAYATRRSRSGRVERSGQLRPANAGRLAPYVVGDRLAPDPVEPRHWGSLLVVGIDDDESDLRPRAPASYLVARAFRTALLGAFEERGEAGEAPSALHGREDQPHLAIVPLPFVGDAHADGGIRGFMLALPHRTRLEDVAEQRHRIEAALAGFMPGAVARRYIAVPGAGVVRLRLARAQKALSAHRWAEPSTTWASVTPVVHSRWRHGNGRAAIEQQVIDDCRHVGLPEPIGIDVLRRVGVRGGAHRLIPSRETPKEWRRSLNGPTSHLRIEFPQVVRGPILMGKARHFGVGLFVPQPGTAGPPR